MKDQTVKIRTGEMDDYSCCLPLFTRLYHGDIGSDFRQTFEDYVREGIVLLAENSGKLVGLLVGSHHLDIDWEGKTAKIDAIIVYQANQKKGIGTKLVKHFISLSRREQCKAVKSRVNTENIVAQKFHESLGFTKANTYEYFLDFQEQDH